MTRSLALSLFVSVVLVYLVHFNYDAAGSTRYVDLTRALVENRTTQVEAYADHPWYMDYVIHDGEQRINTNPGLSYLGYPFYAAFRPLTARLEAGSLQENAALRFVLAHFLIFVFITAIPSAAGAVLVGHLVACRTGSSYRGVFATLLYAFGSIAFYFSTRVNQNVVVAALCVLMFALVFAPQALGIRGRTVRALSLGGAAGLALFIDLSVVPFLLAIMVPVLRRFEGRDIGSAIAAATLPVAALLVYQWVAFGNPFLPAQAYPIPGNHAHVNGLWGVGSGGLGIMMHYLVGLRAGLFVYMPFTLIAIYLLVRRRGATLPAEEHSTILAIFLLYLAFAGSQVSAIAHSFFGPRYLLPALPFLVLAFAVYVRRSRAVLFSVIATVAAFFINGAGASLGLDTANIAFTLALFLTRGLDLPVIQGLRSGDFGKLGIAPEVLSSAGLYLLLVCALVTVWATYWLGRHSNAAPDSGILGAGIPIPAENPSAAGAPTLEGGILQSDP